MITVERKQELITFDRSLLALVKLAPDEMSRHELYRALHFYRKRYSNYAERKSFVLQRIEDGATNISEIHLETGIRLETICRILKELLAENKIRVINKNAGRPGRPLNEYFLV